MSADGKRTTAVRVPFSHPGNVNVTPTRSSDTCSRSQLKRTPRPTTPLSSPYLNLNPRRIVLHRKEENERLDLSLTGTTLISPELARLFGSAGSGSLLSADSTLASRTHINPKLASPRKAVSGLSLPRKEVPGGTRGTFRHARGVVEDGGEGLECCVRVFEDKYWTNMRGMKRDIDVFCGLRMEEFHRPRPLSRLEGREMDRVREAFGGERVRCWAFSALKEMVVGDDDVVGLGELYALLEAEAFVQQVARDQAKAGADAALEADLVIGRAVESALSLCAETEMEASRIRTKDRLAEMRRIAVDELIDVDPKTGAELLRVCADLEVRLAGYREDSEQVLTTKHYAGVMERMDSSS